MNQDDQRFVLMAAAAQAHYAKQQARREARKAALLSQVSALSNSSQPMDPKLQAELERLIRAEAQRTEQENFDWACGMVVGVIVLVGFALFILTAMAAGRTARSARCASSSPGQHGDPGSPSQAGSPNSLRDQIKARLKHALSASLHRRHRV
jgi:chorismate mutase